MMENKLNNTFRILNRNIKSVCIVADVHSCYNSLVSIVDQAHSRGIDKFLLLGDLWDRGDMPNETISFVYDMVEMGDMTVILGNHCYKYIRKFNNSGSKVNISSEQEKTLALITEDTIEKFKKIFTDVPIIGVYDPERKIFLSHAGCRPNDFLLADWRKNPNNKNVPGTYTDFLNSKEDKIIDKKYGTALLYGNTDGSVNESGKPTRLPLTKNIDDDLDGWITIFGHSHQNCFYPEGGNKHSICLDFCSGESEIGGKLAALIIPASGEIAVENLIFAQDN